MIVRILPASEWPRLRQTGSQLVPAKAAAHRGGFVVVQDAQGEIVASAAVFTAVLVDGLWKSPHAGAGAFRALLGGVRASVEAFGVNSALVCATNDDVRDKVLDRRAGVELPGRLLCISMEELCGRS